MANLRQVEELSSLSSTAPSSTQPPIANQYSEFATTGCTPSIAIELNQPFRPRVTIPPSLLIAPQYPVASSTMNMEALSLVSPIGRSTPYQMSGGLLGSSPEVKKRGRYARRKRTTPAQLAELLKIFEINENPNHDVRDVLSKKVGMTNREVQIWFQNHRAKEANKEKKLQTNMHSNSPPLDIHGQSDNVSIKATTKKFQPIQAAPYPRRSPMYSYASSGANQFSAFRRISLGITPDGRTVFLPQPSFTVPNASSANTQQYVQQTQPIQFVPQPATNFLPAAGNTMQAFPSASRMMLVPVFAAPQGFLPASASDYANAAALPMYVDSATEAAANEVGGGTRRESFVYRPLSATDSHATETRLAKEIQEPEVPRTREAQALNALARAASERSLADSS